MKSKFSTILMSAVILSTVNSSKIQSVESAQQQQQENQQLQFINTAELAGKEAYINDDLKVFEVNGGVIVSFFVPYSGELSNQIDNFLVWDKKRKGDEGVLIQYGNYDCKTSYNFFIELNDAESGDLNKQHFPYKATLYLIDESILRLPYHVMQGFEKNNELSIPYKNEVKVDPVMNPREAQIKFKHPKELLWHAINAGELTTEDQKEYNTLENAINNLYNQSNYDENTLSQLQQKSSDIYHKRVIEVSDVLLKTLERHLK